MRLLGPVHVSLLIVIAGLAVLAAHLGRRLGPRAHEARLLFASLLAANEIIWWIFRYSKEGFRFPHNLPLQLCDVTVWSTVLACFTLKQWLVEFSYFAGLAGAGMALITPDLWAPWPSYPAFYFFLAHGGIVIGIAFLVFGRIAPLRPRALRHGVLMLIAYTAVVGSFNWIFKANYMYLCSRPKHETLLSVLGPWPVYIVAAFPIALLLFWLLWLAAVPMGATTHAIERS